MCRTTVVASFSTLAAAKCAAFDLGSHLSGVRAEVRRGSTFALPWFPMARTHHAQPTHGDKRPVVWAEVPDDAFDEVADVLQFGGALHLEVVEADHLEVIKAEHDGRGSQPSTRIHGPVPCRRVPA